MTPEFKQMDPQMADALEPLHREMEALLERVVAVSFATAEAQEAGGGHAGTLGALMAFATKMGMNCAARALEIHDHMPPEVVIDVITRNIREATAMSIAKLVEDIASRAG